jgi:WD40 repeat protein
LSGVIDQVEWSPDGATIAVASSVGVWLYDANDLDAAPRLLYHPARVYDIAFDPTGTRLASGAGDATARLWDVASGELTASFEQMSTDDYVPAVSAVAFSPDGTLLLYGVEETLYAVDTATNTEPKTLNHFAYSIVSLDFNLNGALLAVGTAAFGDAVAGSTTVIDAESGELVSELDEDEPWVKNVQFNPDGSSLLIEYDLYEEQEDFDRFRLWDVETRAFGDPTEMGDAWHTGKGAVFSSSGSLVALSEPNGIVLHEVETGEETATLELESPAISKAFNSNGSLIAFLSDNRLHIWSLETRAAISAAMRHSAPFEAVAVSDDGRYIAAMDDTGYVWLWDTEAGGEVIPLEQPSVEIQYVGTIWQMGKMMLAFDRHGDLLAAATSDGNLRVWNTEDGSKFERMIWAEGRSISALTFNPLLSGVSQELTIVSCSNRSLMRLDAVDGGLPIQTLVERCDSALPFASNEDLSQFATVSGGEISIYNFLEGGNPVFERQVDAPLSLAFSPDGERLAVGTGVPALGGCCTLESLQLWELDADTDPVLLVGAEGEPPFLTFPSLNFSPDGSLLAAGTMWTGRAELPVYLWDVSGSPPNADADAILYGHTGTVSDVQFNADGTLLISASRDGTVRLWGVR